jgi:saccharopine dehydrogenase-like NADP-dependent oxidoreductase
LFDTEPVDVKGQKVAPRDLFAALAYPKMKLRDDEIEFTFFHVLVTGEKGRKESPGGISLYDERDPRTGYHSMARTTGFPCVIVGRLIAEGVLRMPGVNPPEAVGTCAPAVERFLKEMARRGVTIIHRVTEL